MVPTARPRPTLPLPRRRRRGSGGGRVTGGGVPTRRPVRGVSTTCELRLPGADARRITTRGDSPTGASSATSAPCPPRTRPPGRRRAPWAAPVSSVVGRPLDPLCDSLGRTAHTRGATAKVSSGFRLLWVTRGPETPPDPDGFGISDRTKTRGVRIDPDFEIVHAPPTHCDTMDTRQDGPSLCVR